MPERIIDSIAMIECATFVSAPIGFGNWLRERFQPPPRVGERGGKMLRESGYGGDDITALPNEMITNPAN